MECIPQEWRELLPATLDLSPVERVQAMRDAGQTIYPPEGMLFTALRLTPPAKVRAVILGQDPYHEPGQAYGLAFAVPAGIKAPPSLRNILKEYSDDLGVEIPAQADLRKWAGQGVLMLNTVLSVEVGKALSHQKLGWQTVTDAIISACNALPQPVAFILWGKPAQEKARLLNPVKNAVFMGPHPSPLSAYRGFFGSKPFSTVNQMLQDRGADPINWML